MKYRNAPLKSDPAVATVYADGGYDWDRWPYTGANEAGYVCPHGVECPDLSSRDKFCSDCNPTASAVE